MYSLMSNAKFQKNTGKVTVLEILKFFHTISLVTGLVTDFKQRVSDVMIDFCRCCTSHNKISSECTLSSLFLSCFALFHGPFGVAISAFMGIFAVWSQK